MSKSLNLEDMAIQEAEVRGLSLENPLFILDSNAIKYRYQKTSVRIVMTSGVVNEILWKPEIFPAQSIYQIGKTLNPEVINHFVSEEDEKIILAASRLSPKAAYRKKKSIGWADTQQISYALNSARKGEQIALVSNDGDILKTVDQLLKTNRQFGSNLITLSVRKYLERIYRERFSVFEKYIRKHLVRELDKDFRIA